MYLVFEVLGSIFDSGYRFSIGKGSYFFKGVGGFLYIVGFGYFYRSRKEFLGFLRVGDIYRLKG